MFAGAWGLCSSSSEAIRDRGSASGSRSCAGGVGNGQFLQDGSLDTADVAAVADGLQLLELFGAGFRWDGAELFDGCRRDGFHHVALEVGVDQELVEMGVHT